MGPAGPTGPSGVIRVGYARTNEALALPGNFPWGDVAPQITQGSQVLAVPFTPTSTSNLLIFDGMVHWSEGSLNTADYFVAAVFDGTTPSAVFALSDGASNGNARCTANATYTQICTLPFHFVMPVASTAPTTYTLRVGLNTGAVRINSSFNGRQLGGALYTTMSVMEIAP